MNHTEAQMDFILEMHALDNSDEFKFIRPGVSEKLTSAESKAAWEQRLLGKAKDSFMRPNMPSAAVLAVAQRLAQAGGILKKGVNVNTNPKPKPKS